jgi:hypothetical protein
MGTALLYDRCRVGHCDGCVKFEFINKSSSLYTKNDFEQRRSSAYITIILFYVMFYDSGRQPFWIRGPHSQIKKNSQARQNKNLIFLSYLL